MLKKSVILFIALVFLSLGSFALVFIYSEQSRNFIINKFELTKVLSVKIENYFSKKINNNEISIEIETIEFLKPQLPTIIGLRLNNIQITSKKQKTKSKIKKVELGINYQNLFKSILYDDIYFDNLNFKDLTLNAKFEQDKFIPGPLMNIFSLAVKNNVNNKNSLTKILQNEIKVGKIDFKISDSRNPIEEISYVINCRNVFVSKFIEKKRQLNMNCQEQNKLEFSVNGNLEEETNLFTGKIFNLKPEKLLNKNFIEDFNLNSKTISSILNGNYKIRTDKNFKLLNINFTSNNSNVTIYEKLDKKILIDNFNGNFNWNAEVDILKFDEVSHGNKFNSLGEVNFKRKVGFIKFSTQKLPLNSVKLHFKNYKNFYGQFIKSEFYENYKDMFKAGNLNNLNMSLEYDFKENFNLKKLIADIKFSNSRFKDNNKVFKNIVGTVSGTSLLNLEFKDNDLNVNQSKISLNLFVSKGAFSFKDFQNQFKFEKGNIKARFNKGIFHISEVKLFNKNKSTYSLNNIKINNQDYKIASFSLTKANNVNYFFEDIEIDKFKNIKANANFKNNDQVSDYLKEKLNIQLLGDINTKLRILGNLKTFDFNFKLKSNLTNSSFKMNSINLEKKIGIPSFFKSEIIVKNRNLKLLTNTNLSIENNNFEIGEIAFTDENPQRISITRINTPDFNLTKILLTNSNNKTNLLIEGKKLNLSSLKNNLGKSNFNKKIEFDITADDILLNSKISMSGNLKGEVKNNTFNSIAFGKMNLGKASLLDSGEFKIFVNDKISRLTGIGLVGGAQTNIQIFKEKDQFPEINFDTADGGKLLNKLGFAKNIKSGKMKMKIKFLDDSYRYYNGIIESEKFSLMNAPGIINSLSVLSFAGVQSVIIGEGILFEKGRAEINVKNNLFNFDKFFLTNQSLAIKGKGVINEDTKSLDITGTVAPIRLVSRILSLVPAVGQLLTGLKKDGLFAGQFKMTGNIDNPDIKINPMSFAPGILRDIFADDWLNNGKLLLQKK